MSEFTLPNGKGLGRRSFITLALVLAAFATGSAEAATWTVGSGTGPRSLSTVSAAVEEAAGGDTILVSAGTYAETVTCDKAILIRASGSLGSVILDGGDLTAALTFSNITGQVTLDGLEIRKGWAGNGGGVRVESVTGGVVIQDCTFRENHGDVSGAALDIYDTRVTITGCEFINNGAMGAGATSGGAINFRDFCEGSLVEDCTFDQNHADKGGAIKYYGGITVRDCTFTNNWATDGAAVYMSGSSATLENCTFTDNNASGKGGAVYCGKGSAGSITYCTFDQNTAADGGGVYVLAGVSSISNCTFSNNTATNGTALYCKPTPLTVTRCIFTAHAGNAPVYASSATPTFTCNDFWDNAGGLADGMADPTGDDGNFEEDPLFCGELDGSDIVIDGDFSIDSDSPCAPGARDGSACNAYFVGSGGIACGVSKTLETSWGRVKSIYEAKKK